MSHWIANPDAFALHVGRLSGNPLVQLDLGPAELATHMAVYGGTGKGKSKLLELLLRQILQQRLGACVIDPHGDLVEDLLAFLLEQTDATSPEILARVHYLEPGAADWRFAFDPFLYVPATDGDRSGYPDWLHAKVASTARAIIRKQGEGDFEGRPRLERFLTNILTAIGTQLPDGRRLCLADAFLLLDTTHPRHSQVYAQIAPHLPIEVRADFAKVHASQPRDQEHWVESTINRLRSFLSPAVASLFARHADPPIRFRKLIDHSGVVLVNLRRTPRFTIDQGNAIGGLVINEIIEAMQTTERTHRRPFFLVIDEASRFVGQDLIDALAQSRKWGLSVCLAVQDLSSLRTENVDMLPKVLSQCGTQICFQQKNPDDLDIFARLFGYPALDFTQLVHEVDRHDGYDWIDQKDITEGTSQSTSTDQSVSRSNATQEQMYTPQPRPPVFTDSMGESQRTGQSAGTSRSETHRKTALARIRTELQATGRLARSVADQFEGMKQELRTLSTGQAVVSLDAAPPFFLDVAHVHTPFGELPAERRANLIDGYKRYLLAAHPYTFRVDQALSDDERWARFSAVGESARRPPSGEETSPFT